jgi:ubiquinone/menaquinone biosynthesis C-methylase UbiE
MSSRLDTFNRVAPYYASLKRFVFGSAVDESQAAFLSKLPPGRILILGGGSGELLQSVFRHSPDCEIWYVEASSVMLARAVDNVPSDKRAFVHFIHGTEDALPRDARFDALITNFFLDLFPEEVVLGIARKLSTHLTKSGVWLVSDFVDQGKAWQRVLLWTMYRFFVATCGIDARKLPAWQTQIHTSGFEETESASFYNGFIKSAVFIKQRDF